jgi:hypothetical protein
MAENVPLSETMLPYRIWVDAPIRSGEAQVYVENGRPNSVAVEYVRADAVAEHVRELETERDEMGDALDLERRRHEETRGYRQHAEHRVRDLERDAALARR